MAISDGSTLTSELWALGFYYDNPIVGEISIRPPNENGLSPRRTDHYEVFIRPQLPAFFHSS
jgi:hypothetical protein